MPQIQSIGAFDAKARLSELLRQVQTGQVFEISVRGRPVARLTPVQAEAGQRDQAVAKMHQWMRAQVSSNAGAELDLRELIDQGRS